MERDELIDKLHTFVKTFPCDSNSLDVSGTRVVLYALLSTLTHDTLNEFINHIEEFTSTQQVERQNRVLN